MENLKKLFNEYLWLIILIGMIALGAFVIWLAGKYDESKTEGEIKTVQTESKTAQTEAANSQKEADNSAVERRTEDAVRERVIAPKLEDARHRSQSSKIELEQAKQRLNETKNLHNSNTSRADNCARLEQLFPDERFEYCR